MSSVAYITLLNLDVSGRGGFMATNNDDDDDRIGILRAADGETKAATGAAVAIHDNDCVSSSSRRRVRRVALR